MNLDLVVCPACRTVSADGNIHLRTLDRSGDTLVCECGRRYPIVDGIPVVVAHRDLGTGDALNAHHQEHVSTYMDAHWGDYADPPTELACELLRKKIAERSTVRVAAAVDLGCSLGRYVAELANGADHVVGLDIDVGDLRRARKILDGERVEYGRRIVGHHYAEAHVHRPRMPADRYTFIAGDALDPPLIHGMYQRVVALNLLDNVPEPSHLLGVLDGLCARGGEVIFSSPYIWHSDVLADHERIGDADPAGAIARIFREGIDLRAPYVIEDEADLTWSLRMDARSAVTYRIHYLRARKT